MARGGVGGWGGGGGSCKGLALLVAVVREKARRA